MLKPTSGLLEFISKGVNGLGMGILAWGDEVVRIPRTRIRSPRHFGMFAADPTGVLTCLDCMLFPALAQQLVLCSLVFEALPMLCQGQAEAVLSSLPCEGLLAAVDIDHMTRQHDLSIDSQCSK